MTKMQELLGKILKSRIENETTKGVSNVEEIQNTLDILYAGGKITDEQYVEFTVITPSEELSEHEDTQDIEGIEDVEDTQDIEDIEDTQDIED